MLDFVESRTLDTFFSPHKNMHYITSAFNIICNYLNQIASSRILLTITLIAFISNSIAIFDARYAKAQRIGEIAAFPRIPKWVGLIHFIYWGVMIALFLVNWKIGVFVWVSLWILNQFPISITEILGNLLVAPLLMRKK